MLDKLSESLCVRTDIRWLLMYPPPPPKTKSDQPCKYGYAEAKKKRRIQIRKYCVCRRLVCPCIELISDGAWCSFYLNKL